MRHAPATFADTLRKEPDRPPADVVFCSDMLNLPEFLGLSPQLAGIPTVAYFHENQWTYPVRQSDQRDLHFGFTNTMTALAATEVWFNSSFHRSDFLAASERILKRMPDFASPDWIATVTQKSFVHSPGIRLTETLAPPREGPLHIAWAARWEHDKGPEGFFAALRTLRSRGVSFRLSVLGESFKQSPDIFAQARDEFAAEIEQWGFVDSWQAYRAALGRAHVFVSTADHEFFGIAAVEAILEGCFPLLPNRLAYPELIGDHAAAKCLYEKTELVDRLEACSQTLASLRSTSQPLRDSLAARFAWPQRAAEMDDAIEKLAAN